MPRSAEEARLQRRMVKALDDAYGADLERQASASGAFLAGGARAGRLQVLSGVAAGDPDLALREWGRDNEHTLYIEIKTPRGVLTAAQARRMERLRAGGARCIVVRDEADLLQQVAAYLPDGFDASTPTANTRAAHTRIALQTQGNSADAPLLLDAGAAGAAEEEQEEQQQPAVRTVPLDRRKRRRPAGEEEEGSSSSSSVASEHEFIDLCESEDGGGEGVVTDGAPGGGWAAVLADEDILQPLPMPGWEDDDVGGWNWDDVVEVDWAPPVEPRVPPAV